ncbi:MAG: Archaeal fructose,6-bisphosphatase of inositol monophosphatase family [Herbinix sp.]|jgi:myo-inositol-1(or 4)-monophosphatase|nr:Archaeal fructose,6-bisphosphatase of inositol monophosphatase family [Herbinix sp.]
MIDEIIKIVKEAGHIMLAAQNIQSGVVSKEGRANFVTKYDVEVQNFLFDKLGKLYPSATFIGEEEEARTAPGEYCFIIDPIDGTTNFIMDYHHSAISVGLMYHGQMAAGVVYDPYLNELFYAERGTGAFLNNKPLTMMDLPLREGLVCIGTCPYYRDKTDEVFAITRKLFDVALDIRRTGSAALDLCYVAASRFVLFFEPVLSPWDYSAASLIITEAGGKITTIDGASLDYTKVCGIVAATPTSYEEFYKLK